MKCSLCCKAEADNMIKAENVVFVACDACVLFYQQYKNPTIDFKKLSRLCTVRTKELAPELF